MVSYYYPQPTQNYRYNPNQMTMSSPLPMSYLPRSMPSTNSYMPTMNRAMPTYANQMPNMAMSRAMMPMAQSAPFLQGGMAAPVSRLQSLTQGLGKTNWQSILTTGQKTINGINQIMPIINQARPLYHNAKTMFRVAKAVKNTDFEESTSSDEIDDLDVIDIKPTVTTEIQRKNPVLFR